MFASPQLTSLVSIGLFGDYAATRSQHHRKQHASQYQYSLMSYPCEHNPASGGSIAEGQGDEDRGRLWTGLWGYQVNSEDAIKTHGPKVK